MRGTLISIDAWNRSTATRQTVRVGAALNSTTLGVGGYTWEPRLSRRPRLSMQLADDDLTGTVQLGQGEFALNAAALRFPDSAAPIDPMQLDWIGSTLRIYSGDGYTLSDMRQEFVGRVVGGVTDATTGIAPLTIEVDKAIVDVALLTQTYGGGGGADGDVELRGNFRPAGFGSPINIRPVLINETLNIYQVDAYNNTKSIANVFEDAASFGPAAANYATYAALAGATVKEGQWATCIAEGLFRLGADPTGTITCDPVFGADMPGSMMMRWLTVHAGVAAARIRDDTFDALTAAVRTVAGQDPYVDYWTTEEGNVLDLMQRMCASCNAMVLLLLDGTIAVSRAIGGPIVMTLNRQGGSPTVTDWAAGDQPRPWWRMRMTAARSYYVNSPAEIDYEDDVRDMGDYSASETYRQGMVARGSDGARYIYKNATPSSGNAPPNAAYWDIYEDAPDATTIKYPSGYTLAELEPGEKGSNVTETRVSSSITGQGAFATISSAAYGSGYLTGFGQLSPLDRITFGGNYLFESGSILATLNSFKTSLGMAASIFGQGAFATKDTVAYGSTLLTGFGLLSPLNSITFGSNFLLDGSVAATLANFKTSLGQAASIFGQGGLATKSTISSAELGNVGDLANLAYNGKPTLSANWGSPNFIADDPTNAFNGGRFVFKGPPDASQRYNGNSNRFAVTPGEKLFMSFMGKVDAQITGSARAYLRVNDRDGKQVGTPAPGQLSSSTAVGTWLPISGEITVPDTGVEAFVQVYFGNTDGGTAYISDIVLLRKTAANQLVNAGVLQQYLAGNAVRLGTNVVRADNATVVTDATAITSLGTAGGFAGQTAFATLASGTSLDNSIFGMPSRMASFGGFLNAANMQFRNAGMAVASVDSLRPAELGANVTGTNTAASISGQGKFATVDSAAFGSNLLTGFGNLAGIGNVMFGDQYLLESAGVRATLASFRTIDGTAAGITNQAWAATSGTQDRADNQRVGVGTNGLIDTEFAQGRALWQPIWGGSSPPPVTRGINWDDGTNRFFGANAVLFIRADGNPTGGGAELAASGPSEDMRYFVPVRAGDNVYVSAYLAVYRCIGEVNVHWYSASGTYITEWAWRGGKVNGAANGLPDNFDRVGGFRSAPDGAAFACLRLRQYYNGGGDQPYLFAMRPQITVCPAGQTTPPPYVPGSADKRADRTAGATAAGIAGQGKFATLDSAGFGSDLLTGFGNLAGQGNVMFGDAYLLESAGVRATLTNFRTSDGTAAGIAGQGKFATKDSAAFGSDLLTGFGNVAGLGNIMFGDDYLLERANTKATLANFRTIEGIASGITNQGTGATASTLSGLDNAAGSKLAGIQDRATYGDNLLPGAQTLDPALWQVSGAERLAGAAGEPSFYYRMPQSSQVTPNNNVFMPIKTPGSRHFIEFVARANGTGGTRFMRVDIFYQRATGGGVRFGYATRVDNTHQIGSTNFTLYRLYFDTGLDWVSVRPVFGSTQSVATDYIDIGNFSLSAAQAGSDSTDINPKVLTIDRTSTRGDNLILNAGFREMSPVTGLPAHIVSGNGSTVFVPPAGTVSGYYENTSVAGGSDALYFNAGSPAPSIAFNPDWPTFETGQRIFVSAEIATSGARRVAIVLRPWTTAGAGASTTSVFDATIDTAGAYVVRKGAAYTMPAGYQHLQVWVQITTTTGTYTRVRNIRLARTEDAATLGADVNANITDGGNGNVLLTRTQLVTGLGVAQAVTGQGALATSTLTAAQVTNTAISISAAGVLSGAGGGTVTYAGVGGKAMGLQDRIYYGQSYLYEESSFSTIATLANFKTSAGTAAGIAGQGALATKSTADYGSDVSGAGKPDTYRIMARGNAVSSPPAGFVHGLTRGDGSGVWTFYARSYSVVWYDRAAKTWAGRNFDVYGSSVDYGGGTGDSNTGPTGMANWMNGIPAGSPVVVYSSDEPRSNRMNGGLPAAMYRCGASRSRFGANNWRSHGAYILIGMAGAGEGGASAELYYDAGADGSTQSLQMASFSMIDGRIQAGARAINTADELQYSTGATVGSLRPAEAGANITENRTASGIAGQGTFATISSISSDNQFSGVMANRFAPYSGDANYLRADRLAWTEGGTVQGMKPAEGGANITENRTAAAITNQAWAATNGTQDRSDNQRVPVGGNALIDTEFAQGRALWQPIWGGTGGGSPNRGINFTASGGEKYWGSNAVLFMSLGGTPTSGSGHELAASGPSEDSRYFVPVKPGDNVYVAAMLAPHRCSGQTNVHWYNATGGYISETVWNGGRQGGGLNGDPANFDTVGGFATAPANAAFAWLRVRQYYNGGAEPYLFMMRPQIVVCPPGQTTAPPYAPGSADKRADRTGGNTAAAIAGQGAFATKDSVGLGSTFLTGFGNLAGQGNIMFGDAFLLEQAGVRATNANYKTISGTAAGITNQGTFATKSTVSMASNDVTERYASNLYYGQEGNNLGSVQNYQPQEGGANITENRTASAISGQGAFATVGQITRANIFQQSLFSLNAFSLDYSVTRSDGTSIVTESLAITSLGVASSITGQGSLATKSIVATGDMNANTVTVPAWIAIDYAGGMANFPQNSWVDFDTASGGGGGGTGGGGGGGGGGTRPGTVNLQ